MTLRHQVDSLGEAGSRRANARSRRSITAWHLKDDLATEMILAKELRMCTILMQGSSSDFFSLNPLYCIIPQAPESGTESSCKAHQYS